VSLNAGFAALFSPLLAKTSPPPQKCIFALRKPSHDAKSALAGAAIFLASPASKLINGVTIPVDGGYSAS
jgi:hypothetical protein